MRTAAPHSESRPWRIGEFFRCCSRSPPEWLRICSAIGWIAEVALAADRIAARRRGPIGDDSVTPDQSIAAAIASADAGTEVIVEPGEYREQVRLKTGVRVTSRVPRGASLRLPGGASETDAAVIAFEVSDADFSGFRIEGDAATPLGIGIVIRNSNVVVSDVEISGARTARPSSMSAVTAGR